MNGPDPKTSASKLPPAYNQIEKHGIFPNIGHDENARYNFLASLTKYVSTVLSPGNKVAFEKHVEPQFKAQMGRGFKTRNEVTEAMGRDTQYQMYSALRRSATEMLQQSSRSLVLRQIDELAQRANDYNEQRPETLILDSSIKIPRYLTAVDHHCMPGSYYTQYMPEDVANAASYDSTGLALSTVGKHADSAGRSVVVWLKENFPHFKPKRILDIGCGVGHNTIPLALGYPDAQVIAIDVSTPMLRYGHARAVALGVENVIFQQANAEQLPFDDESFDWVQTTMFLHETSTSAVQQIMKEIHRVLAPEGVMLHVEHPQFPADLSMYERFARTWEASYNNDPFLAAVQEINIVDCMKSVGFNETDLLQFGARVVNNNSLTTLEGKFDSVDYDNTTVWNVFGALKKSKLG